MIITPILRGIVKDAAGSSVWRETSQLCLPKGGKKLSFKQNALIVIGIGVAVFSYAQVQSDFNPDSWWGKTYRQATSDPFAFITNATKVPSEKTE